MVGMGEVSLEEADLSAAALSPSESERNARIGAPSQPGTLHKIFGEHDSASAVDHRVR